MLTYIFLLFQNVQNIDSLLRILSINVEKKKQLLSIFFASDDAEENMLSVMLYIVEKFLFSI